MSHASFKPCYKQKFFWIDNTLIAFEFGEDRWAHPETDETIVNIGARYVWHGTTIQGVMTGRCSCIVGPIVSIEEGQRLFDLADEAGAIEWWEQWKKKEQMTDPYGLAKIGQDIKRSILSVRWNLRRWLRTRRYATKL